MGRAKLNHIFKIVLPAMLLVFLGVSPLFGEVTFRAVKDHDSGILLYFHDDCAVPVTYRLQSGEKNDLSDLIEIAEIQTSPVRIPSGSGLFSFFRIDESLDLDILPDEPVLCLGGAAVLDAGPGYDEYLWQPGGEKTQSIQVIPTQTTEYNVTVKLACAADSAGETVTIMEIAEPDILPDDSIICPGGSVVLDAGEGYDSYRWWPGGEQTRSIVVSPRATTTYLLQVTSVCGHFEASETVHVLPNGDNTSPKVGFMTLNDIPHYINGRGPAGGLLVVPPSGFVMGEISIGDGESGVDPDTIRIFVDTPMGGGRVNGGFDAGDDIASFFTITPGNPLKAHFCVPEDSALPPGGPYSLYIGASDYCGNESLVEAFYFQVEEDTNSIRPFERADPIYLDFSRDIWAIWTRESLTEPDWVDVMVEGDPDGNGEFFDQGNGIPDFLEDLWAVGLGVNPDFFPSPIVPNTGGMNVNEVIEERIKESIKSMLEEYFDSISVTFHLKTAPLFPAVPPGVPRIARGAETFSVLCFGGANNFDPFNINESVKNGFMGSNFVDYQNQTDEYSCAHPHSVPSFPHIKGVHSSNIIYESINGSSSDIFRSASDLFIRERGGIPAGASAVDPIVLDPLFNPGEAAGVELVRYLALTAAMDIMARLSAYVAAHELGHSLGAAADGPQPEGLYSGMPDDFGDPAGNGSHHHSFLAFPPYDGFSNIMRGYTTESLALDSRARFCEICKAYLKETTFYLSDDPGGIVHNVGKP